MPSGFELIATDPSGARRGRLTTPHGEVDTPAFMPVGTHGAVRSLSPEEVEACGSQIVLSNTYHLYLRPGQEVIARLGGLHRFMGWKGPILTDSGGFQVFSLSTLRRLSDEGVEFRSHLDGSSHLLTPEVAVRVQRALGSDIAMVLDECPPASADRAAVAEAVRRTTGWAIRCKEAFAASAGEATGRGALFGIVQGGTHEDLRLEHAERISRIGFDGYAVGGVSVGEAAERVYQVAEVMGRALPAAAPRYMMGLGSPADLVRLVGLGFDMFDCVLPTRNARNGTLFTWRGKLHIRNETFARDPRPLDGDCRCPACRGFSRAYLRHLFMSGEILGHRLNTLHNLTFYQDLMRSAREAIERGSWPSWRDAALQRLGGPTDE